MAQNKKARIAQAIIETREGLNRAMRYSPDLRDHDLIAIYEAHLVTLAAMLGA